MKLQGDFYQYQIARNQYFKKNPEDEFMHDLNPKLKRQNIKRLILLINIVDSMHKMHEINRKSQKRRCYDESFFQYCNTYKLKKTQSARSFQEV